MNPYSNAVAKFARINTLNEATSIINWDSATMMPPGGAASRGDQMAVLAGISHDLLTDPTLADDLAEAHAPNDGWSTANLTLMREEQTRATALPRDLVEALTIASNNCETTWRDARPNSDFAAVQAQLTELLNLTRQSAQILGETLSLSPYDALMTTHQRGITAADVTPIFARYETFLATALPAAEERQRANPTDPLPPGPYPIAIQEQICRRLAEETGLDFAHARLDSSAHPFSGGTPADSRITNRYDEANPCAALMGTLHETGHAMYEQHLPKSHARQAVGFAAGMATHESQSLIIEMQAVRSDAYLAYLAPILTQAFARQITVSMLKSDLRHVARSFIRVDADELTYPAHVLLRFRLEQALLSGDLTVADLPAAWNDGIQNLLGITPPDDRRGCLQDIHWYAGSFGYFPSYTLGAMAAAQLMSAARKATPDIDTALAIGDFSPLNGWLNQNIHAQGARLGFNELLIAATGEPLNPAAFETHLTNRYLAQ
jgi:carboxypeptidase Taq